MEEAPLNFSPHEDIAACTNALNALSEYDWANDAAINLSVTIAMDYCVLNF